LAGGGGEWKRLTRPIFSAIAKKPTANRTLAEIMMIFFRERLMMCISI
jgi:hypothetical protein